ncbi:DUF3099 domain-containing protein [Kineococcus gynurae]|uniref:DUF3099 domain-containing protein n=1 Tax=Kineococcus gynurae TaxID=452979 RepID=A0ABV5LQP2_9ACTN
MSSPSTHHHPSRGGEEIYRITSAPTAHAEDLSGRFRRYTISMLIRTGCFVTFVFLDHWTRWIFAVGAVFLPYVAVVLANAGRERSGPAPESFDLGQAAPPPPDAAIPREAREMPAIEARITGIHHPGD